MEKHADFQITATWDKAVVPAGAPRKRGLLIEVANKREYQTERSPVNLALVIDRSGSMNGGSIEAARQAAIGVIENLGSDDVLSVVAFDHDVTTLVDGLRLTPEGKRETILAIEQLNARGTTDLGGGWLKGATCAADVLGRTDFKTGHVVVLSDGYANQGVQHPAQLADQAAEMARRGITTSTVGIGNHYSPLQLEALSEGGVGRLHDAATPDEIIETVLGELGEVTSLVATDAAVTIDWSDNYEVTLLSDYPLERGDKSMTIRLGQLVSNATRRLPLLVTVPALEEGKTFDVNVRFVAKHPETGKALDELQCTAPLKAVTAEQSHATPRDARVTAHIARLWQHSAGLSAMRLNEAGDFSGAERLMRTESRSMSDFTVGIAEREELMGVMSEIGHRVGREWDGRSKREAMVASRKYSRGEQDHRRRFRKD